MGTDLTGLVSVRGFVPLFGLNLLTGTVVLGVSFELLCFYYRASNVLLLKQNAQDQVLEIPDLGHLYCYFVDSRVDSVGEFDFRRDVPLF